MKRKHSRWHLTKRILGDVWTHPANADHRVRAVVRSLGWQVRKRVPGRPVDVPYEGLVLRCHPDSNSASNVFYFTSRYDYDEMTFLDRYLRPADGFLDIGANIGTYSLFAAARCGIDARIEAFEPLPVAAARLRQNFERNHLTDAHVHEVAVDDHAGQVRFLDFDVSSTIDHGEDSHRYGVVEVAQDRIDARVKGSGFAVAKLDVEGLELRALQGAQRLIDALDPPVWQVELIDSVLAKHGASAQAVVTWMAEAGFTPAWFDVATGTLEFSPDRWRKHPNCLFVADARREEVLDRLAGDYGRLPRCN